MLDHKLLVCYLRNPQASTTKLNSHAPHIAKESLYWLQRSPCGRKCTFEFMNISKQACFILATMHIFRLYTYTTFFANLMEGKRKGQHEAFVVLLHNALTRKSKETKKVWRSCGPCRKAVWMT